MENKTKSTTLLLHAIKYEKSTRSLKYNGISYQQIAILIDESLQNGILIEDEDEVRLTIKGEKYLSENQEFIKKIDKNKWIEPDYKNQIRKIRKDEVFLPSRGEFSFLK